MTPLSTVTAYTDSHRAELTIVLDAEHWFHTPAQLEALRIWEAENT